MEHNSNFGSERYGKSLSFQNTDWKTRSELAESITHASIDSLVALDPNLNIISWNAITEQWSDRKFEDVIGQPFFKIFPSATETPGLEDALKQALKGQKTFLPSGPGFYLEGYFETHFVPLKTKDGSINGVLQIIHDVAHRIKAENELKELNNRLQIQYTALQYANEETATFAKIATHDLKEPLRKIYTFAEHIKTNEAGQLSNSGRGHFRRIQESVQRMSLLTDDVANYLSLNAREELQEVDMTSLLREIIDKLKPQITETGARIQIEAMPVIAGYPKALQQLLKQVLTNALKFHLENKIPQVSVRCEKVCGGNIPYEEARPDEEYYCITFMDNGIGFEPAQRDRIFGLFERLNPPTAYRGTGMGLALALKAARMHQGFMKAESVPGQGSTFYCYIPVSKSYDVNDR